MALSRRDFGIQRKNKIDPFLVAAVIKNESNFDRKAVSKVGAIGLMQIMPDTGAWIAEQMGIKNFDPTGFISYRR